MSVHGERDSEESRVDSRRGATSGILVKVTAANLKNAVSGSSGDFHHTHSVQLDTGSDIAQTAAIPLRTALSVMKNGGGGR